MAPRTPGESRAKVAAALAAAQLAHAQDDPSTPEDESQGAAPAGAPPEAGLPPEEAGGGDMQEIQDRIVRLEDILIQNGLVSEEELTGGGEQQADPSLAQQAIPAGSTGAPPPEPPLV